MVKISCWLVGMGFWEVCECFVRFVPIVAFDNRLYRIGYGGGYYDRYIQKLSNKKKLFKIGIAHSCQKINKVPINKYDKKLDIIITEKYILRWEFFF